MQRALSFSSGSAASFPGWTQPHLGASPYPDSSWLKGAQSRESLGACSSAGWDALWTGGWLCSTVVEHWDFVIQPHGVALLDNNQFPPTLAFIPAVSSLRP